MKKTNNIDVYFMIFILSILSIISYIFIFRNNLNLEDFIIVGVIIFNIILAYNFDIKIALLSSIIFTFLYSTYIFIISFNNEIDFSKVYFWIFIAPVTITVTSIFSNKIKIVYEKLEYMEDQYEKLVTIDSKTGLTNLKGFYKDLDREISRSKRHKIPIILMCIKFSYIEELRKLLGKTKFDELITKTSNMLDDCIRNEDILYHLEDNNFAILITDSNLNGSYVIKERI